MGWKFISMSFSYSIFQKEPVWHQWSYIRINVLNTDQYFTCVNITTIGNATDDLRHHAETGLGQCFDQYRIRVLCYFDWPQPDTFKATVHSWMPKIGTLFFITFSNLIKWTETRTVFCFFFFKWERIFVYENYLKWTYTFI